MPTDVRTPGEYDVIVFDNTGNIEITAFDTNFEPGNTLISTICQITTDGYHDGVPLANAEFIKKACNAHVELVDIGQAIVDNWTTSDLAGLVARMDTYLETLKG